MNIFTSTGICLFTVGIVATSAVLPASGSSKLAFRDPQAAIQSPEVGQSAPDFALPDQFGKIHRLSDYKGKTVILAFYPKDMTAG
jgi:cytochrome oxidase Cu insertion factor (SCO1/SenC/PrrC family)